jgi:magnesium chelatase subunit D
MAVLLTDGRANISLARSNEDPDALGPDAAKPSADSLKDEVRDMAKKLGASGINLLVIDTENKFVSTGFAEEIAKVSDAVSAGKPPCLRTLSPRPQPQHSNDSI